MSKQRRIIITGSSGFLGARTAEILLEREHTVALLLRTPDQAWRVKNILPEVEVIRGDMSSPSSYRDGFKKFCPDTLLHSGWIGVSGAERNAVMQSHNVPATAELLNALIESGGRHFIGIGSQAEYGPQNRKLDETAETRPTTLYGHSKVAACHIAQSMCQETKTRFAWLRLFSAYGPRDNPDWLIPSLIKKIRAGERPSLTPCEQLWDFIHIDDAASAVAHVIETETATGIFNLGGGSAPPLRDTVTLLRDIVNPAAQLGYGEIAYRTDQVMHLEADIGKLRQQTGWTPSIDLAKGLKETAEWFI